MTSGYSEFCPIAKASEIFAMRWTPLILRELMCDAHTFNDIHRGVPLISRALLAERLRQLDEHGIIEKKPRPDGSGCEYRLTPAGYAFHDALRALAQWGRSTVVIGFPPMISILGCSCGEYAGARTREHCPRIAWSFTSSSPAFPRAAPGYVPCGSSWSAVAQTYA